MQPGELNFDNVDLFLAQIGHDQLEPAELLRQYTRWAAKAAEERTAGGPWFEKHLRNVEIKLDEMPNFADVLGPERYIVALFNAKLTAIRQEIAEQSLLVMATLQQTNRLLRWVEHGETPK